MLVLVRDGMVCMGALVDAFSHRARMNRGVF